MLKFVLNLEEICPECKGDGWVSCTEWQEHFERENQLKERYIAEGMDEREAALKAYEEMKHCQPDGPEEHECDECRGHGVIPTEIGQQILNFVRKWV